MLETTDTRPPGVPVGTGYIFTVAAVPLKKQWPGKDALYYEWKLETVIDEKIEKHIEKMAVWKAGPLLRALGFKEIKPDVFEWDKELALNMQFRADIVEEVVKDKTYRRLANPTEIVPF